LGSVSVRTLLLMELLWLAWTLVETMVAVLVRWSRWSRHNTGSMPMHCRQVDNRNHPPHQSSL
jgi:hypothetical protein